jgi:hypothetical protein
MGWAKFKSGKFQSVKRPHRGLFFLRPAMALGAVPLDAAVALKAKRQVNLHLKSIASQ